MSPRTSTGHDSKDSIMHGPFVMLAGFAQICSDRIFLDDSATPCNGETEKASGIMILIGSAAGAGIGRVLPDLDGVHHHRDRSQAMMMAIA